MPTNNNEHSDEYYVELARNGDESACEYLLDKYKLAVRSVARAFYLVGAEGEDIVQEGMIGLYKAICTYSSEKNVSFEIYSRLCIKTQILTAIKMAQRIKHKPLNEYVSIDEQTNLDWFVSSPEEQFITAESYDILREKAGELLSKFEMSVLKLYMAGKTYREISEILNKDEKAIDNALQRIKSKLKKLRD